jgi:hypothetical protein
LDPAARFCPSCGAATAAAAGVEAPAVASPPPAGDRTGADLASKDDSSRYLVYARIAKIVALLCLFLPWVTVSCAGQRLATIDGFSLMRGTVTTRDPGSGVSQTHSGSPELLMYLVVAAIGFALFASFAWPRRKAATAALYACAAAAGLAFIEVFLRLPHNVLHAMREGQSRPSDLGSGFDAQMSASVSQAIRTEPAIGFWMAMLALAAAIALNWMIRQRLPDEGPPRP